MKKLFVYEHTVDPYRPAGSFFLFCLFRQPGLIGMLPSRIFYAFLHFLGFLGEETYARKFWSFMKKVQDPFRKLSAFSEKYRKKKRILKEAAGENTIAASALPRCLLASLLPEAELHANAFDPEKGEFTEWKSLKERSAEALSEAMDAGEPFTVVSAPFRNDFHIKKPASPKAVHAYSASGKLFRHRFTAILWQITPWILLTLGAVCVSLVSLYYAAITTNYSIEPFLKYFENPLLPLLNTLPIILAAWILYLLLNSAAASYAVTSVFFLVISWCNFYKLQFRGDPVVAEDIFNIGEAADMAGVYTVTIGKKMIVIMILVVIAVAVLAWKFRIRIPSGRFRAAGIALLLLVSAIGIRNVYLNTKIYNNAGVYYPWSPTEQYNARGFVYPLIYSFTYAFDNTRPDGYSDEKAQGILSEYADEVIPADRQVNIVAVQLEAFSDLTHFETLSFTNDPYVYLHKLEAESLSGTLVDNVFAGGTVDTERSFVTGYATLPTFNSKTMSYLWDFQRYGYSVWGAHPSHNWFYSRLSINQNLGLQDYYYGEDTFYELSGSYTAPDYFLFPFITESFEKYTENGQKCFSFNISYQGHGPYSATSPLFKKEYCANTNVSEESYTIINNYLFTIEDTQIQLEKMIDYFRASQEPTVVVLYGDHMPWLGNNNSVYGEYGMNIGLNAESGFFNYFSTPYIIWANDSAKAVTGGSFSGTGPTVSPIFLMNLIFDACGYTGSPYMQVAGELMERVTVVHSSGVYCLDGVLVSSLPEEDAEVQTLLDRYLTVQYYRKHHFE